MAMDKDSMKARVKAAYNTRTGKTMSEGDFNALIDVCQGIIEELLANAEISVTVENVEPGPSTASGTGVISG